MKCATLHISKENNCKIKTIIYTLFMYFIKHNTKGLQANSNTGCTAFFLLSVIRLHFFWNIDNLRAKQNIAKTNFCS